MEPVTIAALVALALIASYIQSVAGFAMGMMIMAVAGGFEWVSIALLAAAISLLSLVNVSIALRRHWREVEQGLLQWLAIGQIPAIALGLWLLGTLSDSAMNLLKLLLGLFIALGSLSLAVRPQVRAAVSGSATSVAVGVLAGTVGGLFSASGPVMGWFAYRQPLPFTVIRATLLACFAMTTATRTLMVGARGELSADVWVLFVLMLPSVALGSWLGDRFAPPVSEAALKRGAFSLLLVLGIWICIDAAAQMLR